MTINVKKQSMKIPTNNMCCRPCNIDVSPIQLVSMIIMIKYPHVTVLGLIFCLLLRQIHQMQSCNMMLVLTTIL